LITLNLYIRNKTFQAIKAKYRINYNMITFLCAVQLYYMCVNKSFTHTAIYLFCGYYNSRNIKKFINRLIELNIMTLAGAKKYTLTDTGLAVIKELEDNYNSVVYQFCNKHNISL
jgi:predicted transcriptional regulator